MFIVWFLKEQKLFIGIPVHSYNNITFIKSIIQQFNRFLQSHQSYYYGLLLLVKKFLHWLDFKLLNQ